MSRIEDLSLALYVLKKCDFRYGKYVLIMGSSNASLIAGQLAKDTGAAGVMFVVSDAAGKARLEGLGFSVWQNGVDVFDDLIAPTEGRKYDIVIESTGEPASYELLMRAAKRGASTALCKALSTPLNCHICDAIRDQIHFMGILTADDESIKKAERMAASGKLDAFFVQAGI